MRVLVACEYSGTVRDAFLSLGHDAMSCDLFPTDVEGPHYQGDVRDIINDGWDLMIAHPPCTYLCSCRSRVSPWKTQSAALEPASERQIRRSSLGNSVMTPARLHAYG